MNKNIDILNSLNVLLLGIIKRNRYKKNLLILPYGSSSPHQEAHDTTANVLNIPFNIKERVSLRDRFSNIIMKNIKHDYVENNYKSDNDTNININFDFIFSCLRFDNPTKPYDLDHLFSIAPKGLGCCVLPISYLSQEGLELRKYTNRNGIFLNSIIMLPPLDTINLDMGLLMFSRQKTALEFFVELHTGYELQIQIESGLIEELCHYENSNDFIDVTENFAQEDVEDFLEEAERDHKEVLNHKDFFQGIYFVSNTFKNQRFHELDFEIKRSSSDYKNYKLVYVKDIIEEVNFSKTSFKNKNNSIFIPLIGSQNVSINESDINLKVQNYCQVVFNKNEIINTYAQTYFNSNIGKKFIELPKTNKSLIPKLSKKDILDLKISLPDLETQKFISETDKSLEKVLYEIHEMKEKLSENPVTSKEEINRINDIYETAFISNSIVRLHSLVKKGETQTIEFKETYNYDLKTKQTNKGLELPIFKTISGFLNTEGGTLLIGVRDDGIIKGMNDELKKFHKGSFDEFKKKFATAISHKIGDQFQSLIKYDFISSEKGDVFELICKPSDKPVFFQECFYIRTNPRTVELKGQDLYNLLKNRFNN